MGDTDPLVSTEQEEEVDTETAEAIEHGIRSADAGRVVSSEKVRELLAQWISNLSSHKTP
jgi:predicted transcriptional regulator